MVCERRNLRQVRHAKDLMRLPEAPHQATNELSHRASDTAVSLIENQGRNGLRTRGGDRDGESNAG